jgi:hypothetical protein
MTKVDINPFTKKRVRDNLEKAMTEEECMKNCANDFGWRMAEAVKLGLSPEEAFEYNKQFFAEYGRAMIRFAEMVEFHMMPVKLDEMTVDQEKRP